MSESGNNDIDDIQYAVSMLQLERELFIHCQSDLVSEEGLRQIIERHEFTTNHHLLSDYKFFVEACKNKRVTEGIIQCLLDYFPDAASITDEESRSPLHFACYNPNVTLSIIHFLIGAAPASVRSVSNRGNMPLHYLCDNKKVDDASALEILKLLIERCPEAVRHANKRKFPIHFASQWRSPEFCRLLIEAYPRSERITDATGALPLHHACMKGSLATVEYLYGIFPEAINHPTTKNKLYPIHFAIVGGKQRAGAVDVVKFLLDCDPDQKLKLWQRQPLIHFACDTKYDNSNIDASIKVIKALYDARPEVIGWNSLVKIVEESHPQVQAFVNGELVYARQAKEHRLVITPDEHGQLPLHRALRNNAMLGSIKLLVKSNPSAVRSVDDRGAFPLHVACEHHDSTSVVEYILGHAHIARDATDRDGDTPLHCACRGAKYGTIALLLEKYGAELVATRNAQGKLPIDLFWRSEEVGDRESVEYIGSVFQFLKAYPEIVMNFDARSIQSQSGTGKKRKYGN